ncbi:MAG: hypothetical protein N2170_08810 [Bacteroidia bacterium]|nr:hypothetical protein [Bacteroidia bacterium]
MLAIPSISVLEAYARELQRTWLTGKVYSAWSLSHLRENFPSEQVVQFILFQVDTRVLHAMHETGMWDWQDGELTAWVGDFFSRAHAKVSITHVQLSPLLFNAIYHTLQLLTDPRSALTQFYFGQRPALTLGEFSFYSRYIHYFEFVSAALLSYAQRQSIPVIDKTLWQEKVDRILQVYEEETQESIEAYQRRLLEAMTQQRWEQIQQRWKKLGEEAEDLIGSVLSEDTGESDALLKNLFGTSPGEGGGDAVGSRARNPLLSAIDYEPRRVISEQFQTPVRRAETLRRFEIDAIPIHKQFVFIQRIFDGDPVAFRQALDRLNEAQSEQEARALVQAWATNKTDPQTLGEFEKWVVSRFQS